MADMARIAHDNGALILVDGAQAVAHTTVVVAGIGADFYVFSSHNIISSVDAAPMNRLAASLAASIAAVASWESVWTPRCTLARKFV